MSAWPAVRVGVHSGQQQDTVEGCARLWARAEELGYDWISLFDHLRPPLGGTDGPCFEATTLLAALAARTPRIRCALLVATPAWRHPAVLAAAAATIDHVSDGRLEIGLGAGGADLAHAEYGLAPPLARERLERLDEACTVLRALWSGPATFAGRHYELRDAHLVPGPVQERLPLVVGGAGRGLMRVAARHADVWNRLVCDVDEYAAATDRLDRACRDAGREPTAVRRSLTFRAVLDDGPGAASGVDRDGRMPPPGHPDRREYLVVGTPEQCVEALLPYAAHGVRDFLLGLRPPVDERTMTLFAERVAPELRRELA